MTYSTLGYALLGLLARESLSGYDLARQMRAPIGFFWHARHSQIYPELARLERGGLIEHRVVEQHDRPDKKVYSVTPAGREALRAWVTSPMELPGVRDELVLRAYSLWLADRDVAASLFRQQERQHLDRLDHYRDLDGHMRRRPGPPPGPDTPEFAAFATLQRGIGFERGYADWCRWVAEQLEGAAPAPASPPGDDLPARPPP